MVTNVYVNNELVRLATAITEARTSLKIQVFKTSKATKGAYDALENSLANYCEEAQRISDLITMKGLVEPLEPVIVSERSSFVSWAYSNFNNTALAGNKREWRSHVSRMVGLAEDLKMFPNKTAKKRLGKNQKEKLQQILDGISKQLEGMEEPVRPRGELLANFKKAMITCFFVAMACMGLILFLYTYINDKGLANLG